MNILDPDPLKYNIYMPLTLRDQLHAWLREQGYIWQSKPSVKMFVTAFTAGAWTRRSFKKVPVGKPERFGYPNITFAVPYGFYKAMQPYWAKNYPGPYWLFWWDLIQEGRWSKVEIQTEEVA